MEDYIFHIEVFAYFLYICYDYLNLSFFKKTMQIWTQSASIINNIKTLNGGLKISENTFDLNTEIEKKKSETVQWMNDLENILKSSGKINEEIIKASKNVRQSINTKSEWWIIESFKQYTRLLKETTTEMEDVSWVISRLVKIGASIWSIITLIF